MNGAKHYKSHSSGGHLLEIIKFYRVTDPYGCFSNFSRHGFNLDERYWRTSEHYFQANKFIDNKLKEQIRNAPTPMEAAQMGRDRLNPLRSDWEDVKDDIMFKAVLSKFQTNGDIKKILLSTGNAIIVEDTKSDYYWGCGSNRTGKNMLGKILMNVRELL